MKVYVITKAKPFCDEIFIDVKGKPKDAEKVLKDLFPYMRKTEDGSMTSDKDNTWLLFIHEKEV
jgi:hypothetical protein